MPRVEASGLLELAPHGLLEARRLQRRCAAPRRRRLEGRGDGEGHDSSLHGARLRVSGAQIMTNARESLGDTVTPARVSLSAKEAPLGAC